MEKMQKEIHVYGHLVEIAGVAYSSEEITS